MDNSLTKEMIDAFENLIHECKHYTRCEGVRKIQLARVVAEKRLAEFKASLARGEV